MMEITDNTNVSTEIEQPAQETQEQKPKKKAKRKTHLEKLAEAEQKLAQAQAEVDRLKAEEKKVDTTMKVKFASLVIEALSGKTAKDGSQALINFFTPITQILKEEGKTVPKDLSAWIKTKA